MLTREQVEKQAWIGGQRDAVLQLIDELDAARDRLYVLARECRSALLSADGSHLHANECMYGLPYATQPQGETCPECSCNMLYFRQVKHALMTTNFVTEVLPR